MQKFSTLTMAETASKEGVPDALMEVKPSRRPRHRHRGAHAAILAQMEFYFGDANIAKSEFMQQRAAEGQWVDLEAFQKFNKLISLLGQHFGRVDLQDLWKALTKVSTF